MKPLAHTCCCRAASQSSAVLVRSAEGLASRFSDGRSWSLDDRDNLAILNESGKPVATFARGAWASVEVAR